MIKEVEEKVLIALDEIRPFLEKDGGDISLESISDNKIVNVKPVSYTHLTLPTKA